MRAAPTRRRLYGGAGPHGASGGFETSVLGEGMRLHLHRTEAFATTRFDIYIRYPLQRYQNSGVALVSRLLERGTHRLPDLLSLNRFLDDLYGASFSVGAEQFGPWQVIHLYMEVVDRRFLPGGEDLLPRAFAFLDEVLEQPVLEDGAFAATSVQQERAALSQQIASYLADRSAYAQRRCTEEMCRGEPCALPAYGAIADLHGWQPRQLLELHRNGLARCPIDVFICSSEEGAHLRECSRRHFGWRRDGGAVGPPPLADPGRSPCRARSIVESQETQQGRLVLGFRTGRRLAHPRYAALALLDLIAGGEAQSRLYRCIREDGGLAYHVGSYLEPLCGLFYVEAGIEPRNLKETRERVARELEDLSTRGPSAQEVSRAQRVAVSRLGCLADDPEGLTRFTYYRLLGEADTSRTDFAQHLSATSAADVAEAAADLRLDTAYYLQPNPRGAAR
ncbi:MAG: insulinase family protein [Gemmatimonadota bacterium]